MSQWSRLPSADGCAQAEQAAAGARSKHAWRRGSAQSKHAGPTVPPSSLSLLRPPRARPPQGRSGGSCRATRALGAATGGLAHADGGARSGDRWTSAHGGGERRRSERRPADEHTRRDSGLAAPLGPDRGFGVRCGGGGRRPQMDPGRGEKEEKEWAHLNLTQISTP